jgi:hypothetical protein
MRSADAAASWKIKVLRISGLEFVRTFEISLLTGTQLPSGKEACHFWARRQPLVFGCVCIQCCAISTRRHTHAVSCRWT